MLVTKITKNNIDLKNGVLSLFKECCLPHLESNYPKIEKWFDRISKEHVNRRIFFLVQDGPRSVGFMILKKTTNEKKICTLFIKESHRGKGIGSGLVKMAIDALETDKPIMTMPANKVNEFRSIIKNFKFKVHSLKEYNGRKEIIYNGISEMRS